MDTTERANETRLDADGAGYDFVGIHSGESSSTQAEKKVVAATEPTQIAADAGEAVVFQCFSFLLGTQRYVLPKSGFLLEKVKKGAAIQVTREPHSGSTVYGVAGKGLVTVKAAESHLCKM